MTLDEIRRRFPNASAATIARNLEHSGSGACARVEKQLLPNRGTENARLEKAVHRKFRLTITLKYSDNRVRDPDAALSTILDCLVATRRQLEDSAKHPAGLDQG